MVGSERLSLAMDWQKRESCFLFGDGAGAVLLEATDTPTGLLSGHMSCVPDSRECLHLPGWGMSPLHWTDELFISLNFEGQEIFKSAVKGMGDSITEVLSREGLTSDDIICSTPPGQYSSFKHWLSVSFPMDSCWNRDYNTSAASIPCSCDA